jgi:hypothetical protein
VQFSNFKLSLCDNQFLDGPDIQIACFLIWIFQLLACVTCKSKENFNITLDPLFMQLAYLPDRKREYMIDDDVLSTEGKCDVTNIDELVKDYKRNKRRGMLGWFKLRVSSLFSLASDFNVNFDCLWWLLEKMKYWI